MFWLAGAALVAAAIGFALWRAQDRSREEERQAALLALYQSRREELAVEAQGTDLAEALSEELDASFADDLREVSTTRREDGTPAPVMLATFGVVIVCALVYWRIGDPTAEQMVGAQEIMHGKLEPAEMVAWRDRLDSRLSARPDDAATWYLKGHVLLQMEEYHTAAEAFANAHDLQGNDPSIDAFWLQARYMASGGRLDGTSQQIAERLLAVNPNNAMVLELLAVEHFRAGDYGRSLERLNKAISGTRNVERQVALTQMAEQVRMHLESSGPGIQVAVTADAEAPKQATVFVIARPVGGGMPFAVVRRPAVLLPLNVRLDDTTSMNPAMPLSQAQEVEVVVRLSLSGQAMAGAGDWQWQSDPIAITEETAESLEAHLAPPAAAG